jgi:hypothetical protein
MAQENRGGGCVADRLEPGVHDARPPEARAFALDAEKERGFELTGVAFAVARRQQSDEQPIQPE